MVWDAPEIFGRVIMTASDIWSAGLILATLINAKSNNGDDGDGDGDGSGRPPLVTGETPLEILTGMVQLVGRPSLASLEAIAYDSQMNEEGLALYRHLGKLPPDATGGAGASSLAACVPGATPAELDLLAMMLDFNPHTRASADDCLDHPYFTGGGRAIV